MRLVSPPGKFLPFLLVPFLAAACEEGEATGSKLAALSPEDAKLAAWRPLRPPNVVLILIDTLRADAILDPDGAYDTPNIDALGSEGLVFTHAFAHAPMTLPSHTALFSSRPPLETKVTNNWQEVPQDLPVLAQWLGQNGYDSRAVVSLGTLNPYGHSQGLQRGFVTYDTHYWQIARAEDTVVRLEATLAERDPAKPLFLFAHFADPHEPYDSHGTEKKTARVTLDGELVANVITCESPQWTGDLPLAAGRRVFDFEAPGPFKVRNFDCFVDGKPLPVEWEVSTTMEKTKHARVAVEVPGTGTNAVRVRFWINDVPFEKAKIKRYKQEVAYTDHHVGALIERLKALGLYDDSLVLFTSDHGEALGEPRSGIKFFGHVEHLTDEMLHVPLIVKLPKSDPRGPLLAHSLDHLVPLMDVVPTMLDLLGMPPLPGQRGTSLFVPHAVTHVAETHRPEAKKTQFALRDERFKMIYAADDDSFVMYDLVQDPGEVSDVFADRHGERPEWEQLLRSFAQAGTPQTASQGDVDESRLNDLKALGYGGDAGDATAPDDDAPGDHPRPEPNTGDREPQAEKNAAGGGGGGGQGKKKQ